VARRTEEEQAYDRTQRALSGIHDVLFETNAGQQSPPANSDAVAVADMYATMLEARRKAQAERK